ncbi:unnamed protein product [Chrysoparadoxa australica]
MRCPTLSATALTLGVRGAWGLATCFVGTSQSYQPQSEALAARLGLPQLNPPYHDKDCSFMLRYNEEGILCLETPHNKAFSPLYVDFLAGKLRHRAQSGGGEMVVKAVRCKGQPLEETRCIDMTAGLGTDSFVLAGAGCDVVMVERSPVLGALLGDALRRMGEAEAPGEGTPRQLRMRLIEADSTSGVDLLQGQEPPHVAYLDPMFPKTTKSALVKKGMQMLHGLVGEGCSAEEEERLLTTALSLATRKVVVKRAIKSPVLAGQVAPSHQVLSKKCRFDVYLTGN